ncbi:MAG: arginine--tRNA ligase [Alphaproteobacteria bacterium]|nr:arginine--tRNA ligase [Alphaproteobacteria bacterium]
MNLHKFVSDSIKEKLAVLNTDLSNVTIEIPKIREHGDFSTNAAMVLAKPLGQSPRDIANMILPHIAALPFVADTSIAGPGFINIKLKDEFILESINHKSEIINQKSQIIDLDYGGYNIGKDLHIGHLRTTVVGDTFNRIAKHLGHKTKSYNHMGDWGRPMGLIIAWILEHGMPTDADEINKMYPASTTRANEDPEWMERAKKITAELQNGNPEYRKIYDTFAPMSLGRIDDILARLNILPFDENRGERLVAEYIPEFEKVLIAKNLIVTDDGAEIIPVKLNTDNAPMPPIMWRSSAGAQTYAAADLTAVYYRMRTDNPTDIIYFTDSRQNLHFTQVFRASRLAGFDNVNLQHIGYGAVTGADGKPFKTRDGGVASLIGVLDLSVESVQKRVAESGKNLPDETIQAIALAALKFNDLMHDVKSDYIFDADAITSFEGRTGPYILYTAVRLNSILKRVGAHTCAQGVCNTPLQSDERNLLLTILDFNRIINTAFDRRATDMLANYTYDLCQSINTFYHNCPILRDDVDTATRAHRIAIVQKSLETLSIAIDLMGLKIPDEM